MKTGLFARKSRGKVPRFNGVKGAGALPEGQSPMWCV
jgi:hypothetical protein